MGLVGRSLSSNEQGSIEQCTVSRDSTLVEEQGPIEQSRVTGDPGIVKQIQITVIIYPASAAAHCQIEQATVTGYPELGEEQGKIQQPTVSGDQASGEEQGQIEQSAVTGEEQMVQSAEANGDYSLCLNHFIAKTEVWVTASFLPIIIICYTAIPSNREI